MRTSPGTGPFSRVLCVSAHPDDLEFGASATVAALVDDGATVTYVIATRGQSGTNDPKWTHDTLAATREEEQNKAAAVLGVADVIFLDFMDGYVEDSIELRRQVSREIRRHRPELVIGMRPEILIGTFINHPDHRNVATALLDSVLMGATTRLIFPELLDEGLEPWEGIQEVWLQGPGPLEGPGLQPIWVDVAATIDRKVEALKCHASQLTAWDPTDMVKQWAQGRGRECGFEYAEGFVRIVRGRRPPPTNVTPGHDEGAS